MAMSAIYERQSGSVEEYTRHFRPIEGQVGAVFLINGRVVGLDSFGKPDTLSKVFKKEEGYGLIFHDARYIIRHLFRVLYSVS